MKLVFLKSHFSTKGGLEKYAQFLTQAFAKREVQTTLLTTGHSLPKIEGVTVISLGKRKKLTLTHLKNFDSLVGKWLKDNPSPWVFGLDRNTYQTHYRAGNGVHAVYLKRRKMADSSIKSFSFKLNPMHRRVLSYEKKAFENPSLRALFTGSKMVHDEICTHFCIDPQKVHVVHNGVEWEALEKPFENSNYKQGFEFLFVGNGYLRKGLPFLLKGLSLIKDIPFTLSVVGKDKNPKYYIELAKKLQLEERVHFFGVQSTLIPFYQRADAVVIPSIYDPFANVTLEALAMGLYVVSSPFNGGKEVLADESGTVIDALLDENSMAQALKKALTHKKTPERARRIRQSVKALDFSTQLDKMVHLTLKTCQ